MVIRNVLLGIATLVFACAVKDNPDATAKEQFDNAMVYFQDEKFEKARENFTAASFFLAGTELADDARYYIAESYYLEDEYSLAIGEYETLIYRFQKCEWIEDCRYKIAMCRFEISPKYQLDQGETYLALNALYEFLEEFPDNENADFVRKKIGVLREKLAKKYYESGILYHKLEEWHSAEIYFAQIIEKFYDTSYFDPAKLQRTYALFMGGKKEDAQSLFQTVEMEKLFDSTQKFYLVLQNLLTKKERLD